MLSKMREIDNQGFTLIELMVVIAIIGILAAIAIPNFIAYRKKSYCSAAENDAKSVAAAVAAYFSNPDIMSISNTSLSEGDDYNLSYGNSVTIMRDATTEVITITVTETNGSCSQGTNYVAYVGGNKQAGWQ